MFFNNLFDDMFGDIAQQLNINKNEMQEIVQKTYTDIFVHKHGKYRNNFFFNNKFLK